MVKGIKSIPKIKSLKSKLQHIGAVVKASFVGMSSVGPVTVVKKTIIKNPFSNQLRGMRSSWVDYFEYNDQTLEFTMKTLDRPKKDGTTYPGQIYTWDNVPQDVADLALAGSTCKTDDPTGRRRWWPNKQKSLGAAFWYILKPFTASVVGPPDVPMSQTNWRDYTEISGEQNPHRKGAPNKFWIREEKFGRLHDEQKRRERALRGVKV